MGSKNSVIDKHPNEVALVSNVWVFLNTVPERENPQHFYSIRRMVISYRYGDFDYYVNLQFRGKMSYINIDSKGREERREYEKVHMVLLKEKEILYDSSENDRTLSKKINEILREHHLPILPDVLPLNGFRYQCKMFEVLKFFFSFDLVAIKLEEVMDGRRGEPFQAPFVLDGERDHSFHAALGLDGEVDRSAKQIDFVRKEATKLLAKYLN